MSTDIIKRKRYYKKLYLKERKDNEKCRNKIKLLEKKIKEYEELFKIEDSEIKDIDKPFESTDEETDEEIYEEIEVKEEKLDEKPFHIIVKLIKEQFLVKKARGIWDLSQLKLISKLENDDVGKVGEKIINTLCQISGIESNIDGTKTKKKGGGMGDGIIKEKICEIKTARVGCDNKSFQHELGEVPWIADFMIFLDISPDQIYITIFENFTEEFYKKSGNDNTIKCCPVFPTKSITWRKGKGAFKFDTSRSINDKNKNKYSFTIDETTDFSKFKLEFKSFVDSIIK